MCRDSWERVLLKFFLIKKFFLIRKILKFIFQKNESKITINRRGVSKSLGGKKSFLTIQKKAWII